MRQIGLYSFSCLYLGQVIKIYKNPDENPLRRGNRTNAGSLSRPFTRSFPDAAQSRQGTIEEENLQLRKEVEAVRFRFHSPKLEIYTYSVQVKHAALSSLPQPWGS